MKSFEVNLKEKIIIKKGENEKEVISLEIFKPVKGFREKYLSFYKFLTEEFLQVIQVMNSDKKNKKNQDFKEDKNDKDEYDQEASTSLGFMILTSETIDKLFKFLSIGDDENCVCKIYGERVKDLDLDILKKELEDEDIAAILGGIASHFLPILQLSKSLKKQ